MGWNDHVEFIEVRCKQCGTISDWEFWDEIGRERYVGKIGQMLGVDATRSGKCPQCGSSEGEQIEEEDDEVEE